jgi:serine-aspartate repeat-containing protein C/D/E
MKNRLFALLLVLISTAFLKLNAQPPDVKLSLGNLVWNDVNGNGVKDLDEPGVAGVQLRLYKENSNQVIATTTSALDGSYKFTRLIKGSYSVGAVIPSGYTISPLNFPYPNTDINNDNNGSLVINHGSEIRTKTLELTAGSEPDNDGDDKNSNLTLDIAICGRSTVGDFVWNDKDKDGLQELAEPGLAGIVVTLTHPDGTVAAITTKVDGKYNFINLGPGEYTVAFQTPTGYQASPNIKGNSLKDSDPVDGVVKITVRSNQDNLTIDAGFYKSIIESNCSLTTNSLGYFGGFETGSAFPQNTGSDLDYGLPKNGSYQIVKSVNDLSGGGYLKVQSPSGGAFLAVHTGNTINEKVWYTKVKVIPGQTYNFCAAVTLLKNLGTGVNFELGIYANETQIGKGNVTANWSSMCGSYVVPAGVYEVTFSIRDLKKGLFFAAIDDVCVSAQGEQFTLGDYVWNDFDGDGKKDLNEYGLGGMNISLYRDANADNVPDDNAKIATTISDVSGHYQFDGLNEGNYLISMTLPVGSSRTPNKSTTTNHAPGNKVDDDNNLVFPEEVKTGEELFTRTIPLTGEDLPVQNGRKKGDPTIDLALCGNLWMGHSVWDDEDGDGIQDDNEEGINGVLVTITYPDGTSWSKKTYTYEGKTGYYDFPRLTPGTYTLTFTTPEGYIPTIANASDDDNVDSDPVNGSVTITLTTEGSFSIDAGFTKVGMVETLTNAATTAQAEATQEEAVEPSITKECKLKVALEAKNPLCYNNRTGSIITTVTGNNGKVSYSWSNSSTGSNLLNVGEGTYTLKVKDQEGCEFSSEAINLINPEKLTAKIIAPTYKGYNIACKDDKSGSIDLTVKGGSGSYSYTWSNGANSQDIANLAAGKYKVAIKDAVGCTAELETIITEPATKLEVNCFG